MYNTFSLRELDKENSLNITSLFHNHSGQTTGNPFRVTL